MLRVRFRIRWLLVILLGLLMIVAGGVAGFVAGLPTQSLERRLLYELAKSPLIDASQAELDIAGLQLEGTDLWLRPPVDNIIPVKIDHFNVAPNWRSLLSTNQGLYWSSQLLEGHLNGDIYRDGQMTATAVGLNISAPLETGWNLDLEARLEEGQIDTRVPLEPEVRTSVELILRDALLRNRQTGNAFLRLGTVRLSLQGQGRSFELEQLQVDEGDLLVTGGGRVMVGNSPGSTRLNLTLEVSMSETADPTFVQLFQTLAEQEDSSGSYQLQVSGTLARPILR